MRVSFYLAMLSYGVFSGIAQAASINIDFSNGPPPPSVLAISPLNGGTIDFNGGTMNIAFQNPGDGVRLMPNIFNPVCAIFDNVDLQNFSASDILQIVTKIGDPKFTAKLSTNAQSGALVVKLQEDGQTKEEVAVQGVKPADVARIRIDWITSDPFDKYQLELFKKNGDEIDGRKWPPMSRPFFGRNKLEIGGSAYLYHPTLLYGVLCSASMWT